MTQNFYHLIYSFVNLEYSHVTHLLFKCKLHLAQEAIYILGGFYVKLTSVVLTAAEECL